MDPAFILLFGLLGLALSGVVLIAGSLGAGIYLQSEKSPSSGFSAWFTRNQAWVTSLLSTVVAALAGLAAFVAASLQIAASNEATRKQITASNEATNKQIAATIETTKLQVEAALATAGQQIDEGRKQHRLEYLRQYLGQLGPAVTWLHKADRQGWGRSLYASDSEPYKSQLQNDLDDEITFMNSMPQMPFYDDKGTRPADRRDNVVEAIKRYKLALAEPKQHEGYGEDGNVKKAAYAVRDADKWSDDYWAVSRLEMDAREELKKLEAEIEYHQGPDLGALLRQGQPGARPQAGGVAGDRDGHSDRA